MNYCGSVRNFYSLAKKGSACATPKKSENQIPPPRPILAPGKNLQYGKVGVIGVFIRKTILKTKDVDHCRNCRVLKSIDLS